jgi:hypothetical protein
MFSAVAFWQSPTTTTIIPGPGLFVSINEGANTTRYSSNGTTWTASTTGGNATDMTWAAYPMNKVIATTYTSRVKSSTNGITWSTETVLPANVAGPVYSPDLNIACAFAGTTRSYYSTDAITWTSVFGPSQISGGGYYPSVWAKELGIFVAIAGTNILHSSTGMSWSFIGTMPAGRWANVIWIKEKSLFVAVADISAGVNGVATSPNGATWTARNAAGVDRWFDLAYSPTLDLVVACRYNGSVTASCIMTSTNSTSWTLRTVPVASVLSGIDWSPKLGLFVACPRTGGFMLSSSDGTTWATASGNLGTLFNGIKWCE